MERADYEHTESEINAIRSLFSDIQNAGLSSVALCAALETLSLVFIPDLERRAISLGSKNLMYTKNHGPADIEHSKKLLKAVEQEAKEGYGDAEFHVGRAVEFATELMVRIYR